eukprot:TRINITY_DN7470_c0_g1_i6.p1 TRINITY_DN7470_c0_g1~~TRINITY_DN7470_c0_g1_i6.p1  ORF type:complete len:377 (+),score=83.36 TRINITY_DN7470_c0_g1_i6:73-1203(+)
MTSRRGAAFYIKNVPGNCSEHYCCQLLRRLRITTATDLKIERQHGEGTCVVSLNVDASRDVRKIEGMHGQKFEDRVLVVERLEASQNSKSFPISLNLALSIKPKQQLEQQLQALDRIPDAALKPLLAALAADVMVKKQEDHGVDQQMALLQQRIHFGVPPGDWSLAGSGAAASQVSENFSRYSTPCNPLSTWKDSGSPSSDARTRRPPEQAEGKESSESSKSRGEKKVFLLHPRLSSDQQEEGQEEHQAETQVIPETQRSTPSADELATLRRLLQEKDAHSPRRRVYEPFAAGGASGKSASGSDATHSAGVTAAYSGASGGASASPLVPGLVRGGGSSAATAKEKVPASRAEPGLHRKTARSQVEAITAVTLSDLQ